MGRRTGGRNWRPGGFYRQDDRSGFTVRADRTRKEWDGLIIDARIWEPRQPQDLVRGVPDRQNVPDARPLGAPVYIGPFSVTMSAGASPGDIEIEVDGVAGMSVGDIIGVVMDNGEIYRAQINSIVGLVIAFDGGEIPYPVSAGNLVIDYGPGAGFIAPPAEGVLGDFDGDILGDVDGTPLLEAA